MHMGPSRCTIRFSLAGLLLFAQGCLLQQDQRLPLELDEGETAARTIGTAGGILSFPPDFSLNVPAGALSSSASLTVAPRIGAPFPSEAGVVLPGTAFDINPAGLTLASPARVEIRVPEVLLELGDAVRLGIALLEIDAIEIEAGLPPTLGGGTFSGAPSPVSGAASSTESNSRYGSSCSPDARRCFSSGLVRVWISQSLRDRIGDDLVIVAMTVFTDLDFSGSDAAGQPTSAVGEITVAGTLKARLGQTVTSYDFDEHRVTGSGGAATVTGLSIAGNQMVFGDITGEGSNTIEFGLTRIATGELLTLRIEEEIELDNDDGSTTTGTVILHVRLRR